MERAGREQGLLGDLYRFHVEVDDAGLVTAAGASLRKIAPDVVGRPLGEVATSDAMLVSTKLQPNPDWCGVLLRLRLVDLDVSLRGAFVNSLQPGRYFFAGSLDPEDADRLGDLGLTSADFSPTDLTLDFAMLRWARDAQVRETKAALERLEESIARGRQLEELVTVDPLTGLPNRLAFFSHLDELIEGGAVDITVLMLDIDRFKMINDRFGHDVGDQALVAAAYHLQSSVGEAGLAARLGGDEFAAVLARGADVDAVTGEILSLSDRVVSISGNRLNIGLSLGIARLTNERDSRALLGHADIAMYEARATGRPMAVFDPSAQEHLDLRRAIADELPSAMRRGAIDIVFQPVVELESARTHGFEVLSRWNHCDRGPIRPDVFIDVAERTRQIQDLDEYVLDRAVQSAFDLLLDGELPRLCVNLSAMSLNPRLVDYVAGLLDDYDFPASKLTLEVTETASVVDLARSAATLDAIHDMGVSIALDDFGTGFASLTYLQELPVDVVKVDRTFVAEMCDSEKSLQLVRSIVHVARSLDLIVVAEGIETVEQQLLLRNLGVERAQGYLFARPEPIDVARAMLGRVLPLAETAPEQAASADRAER